MLFIKREHDLLFTEIFERCLFLDFAGIETRDSIHS